MVELRAGMKISIFSTSVATAEKSFDEKALRAEDTAWKPPKAVVSRAIEARRAICGIRYIF